FCGGPIRALGFLKVPQAQRGGMGGATSALTTGRGFFYYRTSCSTFRLAVWEAPPPLNPMIPKSYGVLFFRLFSGDFLCGGK
ncbi:hypothetical protein HQ585_17545, partial [candidate division KSB1 bacterium]|nr:hypothetical protein [candidate division KSB1 bacterium]